MKSKLQGSGGEKQGLASLVSRMEPGKDLCSALLSTLMISWLSLENLVLAAILVGDFLVLLDILMILCFLLLVNRSAMAQMIKICEEFGTMNNLKFSTDPSPAKSKTKCLYMCGQESEILFILLLSSSMVESCHGSHMQPIWDMSSTRIAIWIWILEWREQPS